MIESAQRIIDTFGPYITSSDRYIIDSCMNLAKWHILFEAATRLDYLNAIRSFYIYKIDEYPAIPIISIYTDDFMSSNSSWKFTSISTSGSWSALDSSQEVVITNRIKSLEDTIFHVDYVDSLTKHPIPDWFSKIVSDYKQLESTIQEAYVKVLELETV